MGRGLNSINLDGKYIWKDGKYYEVYATVNGKEVKVKNEKALAKEFAKVIRDAHLAAKGKDISSFRLTGRGIEAGGETVKPDSYERRFKEMRGFIGDFDRIQNTREKLTKAFLNARQKEPISQDPTAILDPALKMQSRFKGRLSKEEKQGINIAARTSNLHELAKHALKGAGLTAVGNTGDGLKRGRVVPTSWRNHEDELKRDHLMNAYYSDNASSRVIRSGVIDSDQKKDEFFEILGMDREDRKKKILSLQLNGVREDKMIERQHRLLLDQDNVEVAHIITPANRWVNMIQDYLHPIPLVGKMVDAKIKGEEFAHKLNMEGMLQLWEWTGAEIPSQIQNDFEHVKKGSDVPNSRKRIIQYLNSVSQMTMKTDIQKLYQQLLKQQLGTIEKPMSREQESLMFLFLAKQLNIDIGINCKSGLDRTGWLHAAFMALPDDPHEAYALISRWDENTRDMNQLVAELGWRGYLDLDLDEEDSKVFDAISEYRKRVYQQLVTVALPITAISTGLHGLKWGKGTTENLIPLNFIPPVGKEEGKEVVLVTYDKVTGKPLGLTKQGRRRLTQSSHNRKT